MTDRNTRTAGQDAASSIRAPQVDSTVAIRRGVRSPTMHDALNTPEGRRALADRDIGTVYRLLNAAGVSQRDIAELTGQSQSEVSEILTGRRVMGYDVFVKIAKGLDIPRGFMGLAYDEDLLPEVDEDVKRRELLASGGLALFDRPVFGHLLGLPRPPEPPTPLPSRLGKADVTALNALTAELRAWSQRWGGGAQTISAVAYRSEQLLGVPASEEVHRAIVSVIANLHTVAGFAAFDEELDDLASSHFAHAISFAGSVNDPYWIAFALYGGGRIVAEAGYPNDALKYYQLAHVPLADDNGRHGRASVLTGYLHGESALELAALKHRTVHNELAAAAGRGARDADSENITAETHLRMGNLDLAHLFATSAVDQWVGSPNRRHAVISDVTLAVVNVTSGEPRGLSLAHKAIASVSEIQSNRARTRLRNLIAALESRSGNDYRDLAVRARRVAGQEPPNNV
jgi:transcriptional regulator with XRE-family HTH domain